VKNTKGEKVGGLSHFVELSYVNQIAFHNGIVLWKSPVDKPVETVEKFCVFTGIPGFWKNCNPLTCGKLKEYAFP